MSEHSLLSASGAGRWTVCTASISESREIPEQTNQYAERGTAAHDKAASWLKTGTKPEFTDREMEKSVEIYVTAVESMTQGAKLRLIEESLDTSSVIGVADQKGTGDCIALMPDELQVHDYKSGREQVDAPENKQLIIYGNAAMELVELIEELPPRVRLVIHQPAINHVSEVVYTIEEMREFRKKIRSKAQECMQIYNGEKEATYSPGEKACRWCPARGKCEALAAFVRAKVAEGFDDISDSIAKTSELPVERLAADLDIMDLVSNWMKARGAYALKLLLDGKEIPRYKLVLGKKGNREWKDEKQVLDTMHSMRLTKDEMYQFVLVSPTVAEERFGEKRSWKRLANLVTQALGKPTIAPETDKRERYIPVQAKAEDFEDLTGNPVDNSADDLI